VTEEKQADPNQPEYVEAIILFADIVGSVHWSRIVSDEDYYALLEAFQTLEAELQQQIASQEALNAEQAQINFTGDELCAIIPIEKEDKAPYAAAVGLALWLKLQFLALPWNSNRLEARKEPAQLGIGLHVGKVRCQSGRRSYEGHAISVGKRVETHSRHGVAWKIMLSYNFLANWRASGLPSIREFEVREVEPARLAEGVTVGVQELMDAPLRQEPISRQEWVKVAQTQDVRKSLKQMGKLSSEFWALAVSGDLCLTGRNPNEAIPFYHLALSIIPGAMGLRTRYAMAQLESGFWGRARQALDEISPVYPSVQDMGNINGLRAAICIRQGDWEEAVNALRTAAGYWCGNGKSLNTPQDRAHHLCGQLLRVITLCLSNDIQSPEMKNAMQEELCELLKRSGAETRKEVATIVIHLGLMEALEGKSVQNRLSQDSKTLLAKVFRAVGLHVKFDGQLNNNGSDRSDGSD